MDREEYASQVNRLGQSTNEFFSGEEGSVVLTVCLNIIASESVRGDIPLDTTIRLLADLYNKWKEK